MEKGRTNYNQDWGNEIARQYRRAWNGQMAFDEFARLFAPSLIFHFHDAVANGVADFWSFIQEVRRDIPELDLADATVLSHEDKILLFYRWSARRWHQDIVGGGEKSNYCKLVLRVESGRIVELWQQSPDFLYLLGKRPVDGVMHYPAVVKHNLLVEEDGGIFPADDVTTAHMSALFEGMNDGFLNRASLRAMGEVLHDDVSYDFGGRRDRGLTSWKTFVYGLRTCIGDQQGTRFDDLYIRNGDAMRVFLRVSFDQPSPYLLDCAQGLVAWMNFESRDEKIHWLEGLRENYVQFFDTDLTAHPERVKQLFHGQREPVLQATRAPKAIRDDKAHRKNYFQAWGNEIARQFRQAWSGRLAFECFGEAFDPSLVFHFHDQDLHGIEAYQSFISEARIATKNLDVAEEMVFSHGDLVQMFYRWTSDRWHRDIVGGGAKSNYCKVVMRVANGRIAEIWQQTPDFIYLLGKLPLREPMQYPKVVEEKLLVREEGAIYPSDDAQTRMMSQLFMRMNDCFLNRSSLRNMKDIQNEDIVYNTGGAQGMGVQSWKTFAYALHTCLGTNKGTRFDDLYVRVGDRMRVFLRGSTVEPSPYILKCAEGSIAAMMLTAREGKIRSLETSIENYIQFLDTDFNRHSDRLKNLFQGMREPVTEAVSAPYSLPPATATDTTPIQAEPDVGVEKVAIIGMAGRFPKCASVDELWQALSTGQSLISEIPQARAYLEQGTDIRYAGFILEPELFDAPFFQVLPSEAEYIDPQQRLLMEEIVHSIEDSGHAIADFGGDRTGLFIATLCEDYKKLLQDHGLVNTPQTWAGNENAMFPAKVARFLNIQGPCHFVNAECTSSLVAIHQASQLIRDGRIDQAIVGASNLLLHPYGFVVRRDSLLTDEPHANLFSKNSRGQLRGEAIVSVVLKSLSKAIEDGDRIYGIVAGSAVNNSGKTLSLVAGNVAQQAKVITEAWRAANVGPADVSLIECHASGVRGGDFAEVAAIKQALATSQDPPEQACRIATAKGAIGHSEAASGLSSLVKVLLQLRHGQIAGIQGFDQLDPELGINLNRLEPVASTVNWNAHRRVAGINGFAAGGYNAHVVIEGYAHEDVRAAGQVNDAVPQVVVLSAHSETSLTARMRDLRTYLRQPGIVLADLAFSLQRRDAMKHRAAFVVSGVEQLASDLDAALSGEALPSNAFFGKKHKAVAPAVEPCAPVDMVGWLGLAKQWTEGLEVAWTGVTPRDGRRLLTDLPQYPFDKKRYWIPAAGTLMGAAASTAGAHALHPLLQQNVSSLYGQRYRSIFDGNERVLADHMVKGHRVLPGVAYLEMVRAAVRDALPADASDSGIQATVQLRNVVWVQPIALDPQQTGKAEVQLELSPLEGKSSDSALLAFEVFTIDGEQRRLHCQGQASVLPAQTVVPIDLDALRRACGDGRIEGAAVYKIYDAMGLQYGPCYRSVVTLGIGRSSKGARQVLAELSLPFAEEAHPDYVLHPSMMDGAVHSAIGLVMEGQALPADGKPPLPFALEFLEVLRPCAAKMWGWIRFAEATADEDHESESLVQKLDIDLLDASGQVCVRMRGFSSRTGSKEPRRQSVEGARTATAAGADTNELHERVLELLKQQVAVILQVAADDVDPHDELSQYGFDSINLTSFGNRLNEAFLLPAERAVNPTIFFEYPTLASFTRYLVREHRMAIEAKFGTGPSHHPSEPMAAADEGARHNRANALRLPLLRGSAIERPVSIREDIAIVGVSGRFPLADDIEEFWANLVDGRDCITQVPPDRWDWRQVYGPLKEPNKTDVKWAGFIDGVGEFDPLFFGISPREAELMDPQQRLLMQHVWSAIEDAGHNPRSLSGTRTGVFLGTAYSGYTGLLTQANNPIEGSTATGALPSVGPNRISFFLNLHGPSEPIETACSSSLVAIHRAIAAIQTGSCDMALVGGVNTIVTPDAHIGFRKAGMLCEDGRCKTFSSQANGYVRGEGVGVLFLKKLADAERSGDPIYAVIKGSAENHGGRANSLTSPNPTAQAELIKAAHTQAGIDPRSVGYIEAHGTGTELGDPIEVNGLKSAFNDLYQCKGLSPASEPHCGLGSVKSNIGHLELAAGVAGVIKVLMQMKHKTLVKSLHTEELNPYIQLHGTPFYVMQHNRDWKAAVDEHGRELPRRAGVSAFSFGGANAHVVIEEYLAPVRNAEEGAAEGPWVIVLSAKTQPRLQEAAQRLLKTLQGSHHRGQAFGDDDLPHIAYTLQVGREAMTERLALIVHSMDELREKIQAFLAGDERTADVYRGTEKANRDTLAIFGDEDLEQTIVTWLAKGKLKKLAELWVKGIAVDWEKMYPQARRPRRLSLPAYPFARERYWVPTGNPKAARTEAREATLHPLIHRNTSDFASQRYSATFDGQEFFFRDHVVMQHRLLPAVAYLEMARAAVADAVKAGVNGVGLRNVVWAQPIAFDNDRATFDPATVHVGLTLTETGDVSFNVYTHPNEGEALSSASRLHCQGIASVRGEAKDETLDLAALQLRCAGERYSADQVYAAFDAMGLSYGPAHRAVVSLQLGANAAEGEILACLQLPKAQLAALGDFVLHPSLLDAALQAGIGFMLPTDPAANPVRPRLPFHLKELEVLAPCKEAMWAWVRRSPALADLDRTAQSIDIDLCDEAGRVCARIRGFVSRELPDKAAMRTASASLQSVVLAPTWEPVNLSHDAGVRPAPDDRVLIMAGDAATASAARSLYPHSTVLSAIPADLPAVLRDVDHIVWIAPDAPLTSLTDDGLVESQEQGVLQVFAVIKTLLALGQGAKSLGWTFVTSQAQAVTEQESPNPAHAAVLGLAGSLAKEYPAWKVRAIDLPSGWARDSAAEALLRQVVSLPFSAAGSTWTRRDGEWYQQKLAPIPRDLAPGIDDSAYKMHGVYVVIGGAGGIGEVWSEYMIRTYQAQIIWIGRRELDDEIGAKLDRLDALGPRPRYVRADATQRTSLQAAYEQIKREFAHIHGVVHSALVLKDQSLANMDEAGFRAALSAKVDVSVRLAQVFGIEPLDFVLFFSSLVAFGRPPGQSNYVAGCVFKDAFAQRMAQDWPCAVKVMNWGFWGSVGVAASDSYRTRMAQLGVGSIEPAEAMASLEDLMRDSTTQVALVNLTKPIAELARGVYASFLSSPVDDRADTVVTNATTAATTTSTTTTTDSASVSDHVIGAIKQVLSDALKVDSAAIDVDEPFTGYGLDSITGVHLAQTLNETFGVELDVTLFFDYSTVRLLSGHLLDQHADAMARSFDRNHGAAQTAPTIAAVPASATAAVPVPTLASVGRFMPMPSSQSMTATADSDASIETDAEGIAIVGLSGSFPGARNAEELWSNLLEGKDCVTEVPAHRWNWRQVTGDPTQDVDRTCFKWGAFLDDIEHFDADFFGVAPEEAKYMSPQQRLLLTHVWKAVEDAAIVPKELSKDPTGVFIATVPSEYLNMVSNPRNIPLMVTGLTTSMIPNRISHSLNLRGPSEHCDTACSSTMVALHRAVQSIRNGECRQAIVGAVNLLLTPAGYIGFESMDYLSPSGKMAAFQAEANGFVRAESVGAVILKPLRQAIQDGNQIHAVIRGTGVSHGGQTVSMTTPNGAGMREAIRQAYETSGIDPRTVSYVEAHGIASPLGDAIEISALKSEYQRLSGGQGEVVESQCHIGSARTCVGYPEVASGMLALVKVLMALRHRTLPGVPRFTQVHENISLKNSPFRITSENRPWNTVLDNNGRQLPRRAAINNYGFSGVNAHVVLEEYVPAAEAQTIPTSDPQLFVLSARTPHALRGAAGDMLEFVRNREKASLENIAYTLQKGREPMDHRLAIVASDRAGLIDALQHIIDAGLDTPPSLPGTSVHVGVAKPRGTKAAVESVASWLEQYRFDELAAHWITGGDVPWERLHEGQRRRRISLPGHPLEPTRHWIPKGTGLSTLHSQKTQAKLVKAKRSKPNTMSRA